MKAAGLATAVVTASANGEQVVAAAGFGDLLDARIDGIVAQQQGLRGKPAPTPSWPGPAPWAWNRRRRWCSRTPSPGSRPGGRGTSASWSASTGWATPRTCAAHGADVVVTDLAQLLEGAA